MSVWALIPVKPFNRAKSRLAEVLSPEERSEIAESMFRRTLNVVNQVPAISGTLVISRDGYVLGIARDSGVHTVQEAGAPELNNALMRATKVLSSWRAGAIIILPADIPLISGEELSEIIALGQEHDSGTVVIASDHNLDGTNVLMVRPPGLFSYAYGGNSYERHIQLARLAGATVKTYESERLKLDIDVPEDLVRYQHYVDDKKFNAEPLLLPDSTS